MKQVVASKFAGYLFRFDRSTRLAAPSNIFGFWSSINDQFRDIRLDIQDDMRESFKEIEQANEER